MVNADVEPIKSVPCAIFLGTKDDMLSVDGLAEVRFSSTVSNRCLWYVLAHRALDGEDYESEPWG